MLITERGESSGIGSCPDDNQTGTAQKELMYHEKRISFEHQRIATKG